MTPILIVMVGLPRSGKSTWARVQSSAPIVCPDAIRLALHGRRFEALAEPFVWAIAHVMVRALFAAGHAVVILDACNTTKKRREEWRSANEWRVLFQVIDTPAGVCIERAHAEGDEAIVPVIERMAAAFEAPEENENGAEWDC